MLHRGHPQGGEREEGIPRPGRSRSKPRTSAGHGDRSTRVRSSFPRQDELKRILEGSLEEWRIFLHPYQRKLVRWKTHGPMHITGAAGTGKTVALMHRAVHLARELADAHARVLITTFTTNLSITIKHLIQRLAPTWLIASR